MFICICTCICRCMYVCVHVSACARGTFCVCVCEFKFVYVHEFMIEYVLNFANMYICLCRTCMCVHMCTYPCVYESIHMSISKHATVSVPACLHVNIYPQNHIYRYTFIFVDTYCVVCVHACMCATCVCPLVVCCTCSCAYIPTYMQHLHTQTCSRKSAAAKC